MDKRSREDAIAYRVERAQKCLDEVELLASNQLYNTAVNRMYYGCFHSVSALLLQDGIRISTHSGLRQIFALHYVKTGIVDKETARILSKLCDKRQRSDYDDFVDYDRDEVMADLPRAREFVQTILSLIKKAP